MQCGEVYEATLRSVEVWVEEGGGSWLGCGGLAAWSWYLLRAGSLQLLGHAGRTHLVMAVTHSSLRTDSVLSTAPLRRLVLFWLILFFRFVECFTSYFSLFTLQQGRNQKILEYTAELRPAE